MQGINASMTTSIITNIHYYKNCNSLERIIGISEPGNAELVNECKSCCTNKIVADEQYEYAVLEVLLLLLIQLLLLLLI